jgi:hypothetical protein
MPAEQHDDDLALALVAAVESYAFGGAALERVSKAVEQAIGHLLYGRGGDGILELSIARPLSFPRLTMVGIVIWVTEQTLGPIEAEFHLDEAGRAVTAFTVRAGDGRILRRDAPKYPGSWRAQLQIIATRPTADEDWEHVFHHDLREAR